MHGLECIFVSRILKKSTVKVINQATGDVPTGDSILHTIHRSQILGQTWVQCTEVGVRRASDCKIGSVEVLKCLIKHLSLKWSLCIWLQDRRKLKCVKHFSLECSEVRPVLEDGWWMLKEYFSNLVPGCGTSVNNLKKKTFWCEHFGMGCHPRDLGWWGFHWGRNIGEWVLSALFKQSSRSVEINGNYEKKHISHRLSPALAAASQYCR